MKISEIACQIVRIPNVTAKTASSQDSVIVRVRTACGLEGIGEADSSPEVVKAIVDAPFSHNIACGLRQILVGENPLEHERLWQKMYRRTMYFGRTGAGITAMAAVDMALWDLKGKALGQPIHRLLGGRHHSRLRGYASILFGRDGKETADIARRWVAEGYTAVKFGWEPMGTSEAVDIDLVRGPAKASATPPCSSTPAAFTTRARPSGGPTRSPNSSRNGSRNRCARTTSRDMSGSATDPPFPSPRARGNAGASRSGRSSTGGPWMSTRWTYPAADSPTRHTFARGLRKSGRGSATTATPVRSPSPPACTGSAPAATPSSSRTASRTRPCATTSPSRR